jgi:hypothetical protein
VESNWSKHALLFNIDTDLQNYATHSTEDKDNYMLNLGGRFDVLRDSFLHANFTYGNQYENRGLAFFGFGNNDQFSSLKPVNYDTIGGTIGYEHKMNRIRLNVDNDTTHLGYVNGVAPTTGATIYNDKNRSRLKNESSIRVGYEINPNYEAFVKGSYNFIDYDSKYSDLTGGNANDFQRSSDGFKIVTGVALDLTGKLTGNAYVGYQEQSYDDSRLATISGATGGLGLKWLPTGLTTVKLNIDRAINETTQGTFVNGVALMSSGYFSTSFMANIDHELMRNLLLNVNGGYILNDYKGGNNRQEDVYVAGISAKYLINRNFYLKGGYNYNTRSTNIFNTNYDINSVYFTIGSQL